MPREQKAKLIALHVVPAELIYHSPAGALTSTACWSATPARILKAHAFATEGLHPDARARHGLREIIARRAQRLHATMIIMGSHCRTGLSRFLLGSVAERTVRYAHCPVLIVK